MRRSRPSTRSATASRRQSSMQSPRTTTRSSRRRWRPSSSSPPTRSRGPGPAPRRHARELHQASGGARGDRSPQGRVEKVYALQAGREIRVIVKPGEIDDDGAVLLSARNRPRDRDRVPRTDQGHSDPRVAGHGAREVMGGGAGARSPLEPSREPLERLSFGGREVAVGTGLVHLAPEVPQVHCLAVSFGRLRPPGGVQSFSIVFWSLVYARTRLHRLAKVTPTLTVARYSVNPPSLSRILPRTPSTPVSVGAGRGRGRSECPVAAATVEGVVEADGCVRRRRIARPGQGEREREARQARRRGPEGRGRRRW